MRVLICRTHGFRFSAELCKYLGMGRGQVDSLPRHDSRLIAAVERLGRLATESTVAGDTVFEFVELPDMARYCVASYDGMEAVILGLPETLTVFTGSGSRSVNIGDRLDIRRLVEANP